MSDLKAKLRQMALTPKTQLKRLAIGTLGALICMLLLILTSHLANPWLFYSLSILLAIFTLYAIPGYLGIWLWRMRKFFFDIDE